MLLDLLLPGGTDIFDTLFSGNTWYMDSSNARQPNASEGDVANALAALQRGDIEFVILEDAPNNLYLQTAGSPDEGFVLEYNDGGKDYNYRAATPDISQPQLTQIFTAFLLGSPTWRTMFTWNKVKF